MVIFYIAFMSNLVHVSPKSPKIQKYFGGETTVKICDRSVQPHRTVTGDRDHTKFVSTTARCYRISY